MFVRAGSFLRRSQSLGVQPLNRQASQVAPSNSYVEMRQNNIEMNRNIMAELGISDLLDDIETDKHQETIKSTTSTQVVPKPRPESLAFRRKLRSQIGEEVKPAITTPKLPQLPPENKRKQSSDDRGKENPPSKRRNVTDTPTSYQHHHFKRLKSVRGKRVNAPVIRKKKRITSKPPKSTQFSFPINVMALRPDMAPTPSGVPLCHHGEPCDTAVSRRKHTANYKRAFFKCARLSYQKPCSFFAWGDANVETPPPPPVLPSSDMSDADLDVTLSEVFGYSTFLPGQREAIEQLLAGHNTLAVLATGAGKSLIYQMVAYMKAGVTLVIAPLVALMEDQMMRLPVKLPGNLLKSGQSFEEQRKIVESLKNGSCKVLFLSPEKYLSESFQKWVMPQLKIALMCVDEAHCISEWSHNFRPAFLHISENLPDAPIIALTATATKHVENEIVSVLKIHETIRLPVTRPNIQMTCSRDENRENALITLLDTPLFRDMDGILIYVTKRKEADNLSTILRAHHLSCDAYHAGMTSTERDRVQKRFMERRVRIVVATIAFGLGLDRPDIRSVIHYCLPKSIENYAQEMGRSGRDGKPAHCHVFLDERDIHQLKRLVQSDGVEWRNIKLLLDWVINGISTDKHLVKGERQFTAIPKDSAVTLDMKTEVIETLLVFLEQEGVIKNLPETRATIGVRYHNPKSITTEHKAIVSALDYCKTRRVNGLLVAPLDAVAAVLHYDAPSQVIDALASLQTAGVSSAELSDPAWLVRLVASDVNVDDLTTKCHQYMCRLEKTKIAKLYRVYELLSLNVSESVKDISAFWDEEDDEMLFIDEATSMDEQRRKMSEYFEQEEEDMTVPSHTLSQPPPFLKADTLALLNAHRDRFAKNVSPRIIARILHGVPSPAFPIEDWRDDSFWGRHSDVDFDVVVDTVKAILPVWIRRVS